MQNQNDQNQNNNPEPVVPGIVEQGDFVQKIAEKIRGSENILVALSRDPSVDEMAAAIGLTMFLDGMQKHATAIYSGQTPNALQFLKPETTFERNTNSLQDFIIALNKDKADHLRYKLEGDFVKVYITPYKTTITERDLEFSHGDFNVDLVIALGVPTAGDLDAALTEYGRIMHDASTVDITVGAPGRFGEIEWSEPGSSSVSEMVTRLALQIQGTIEPTIATALLTGVVAATGRFSNARTNAETMQLASQLMEMGADQQLIAANVDGTAVSSVTTPAPVAASESVAAPVADVMGALEVKHDETPVEAVQPVTVVSGAPVAPVEVAQPAQPVVIDTTPAVEAAVTVTPEVDLNEQARERAEARAAMAAAATEAVNVAVTTATENAAAAGATGVGIPAPVLPPVMVGDAPVLSEDKDYSKMIEQALAEPLPVETAASAAGLLNNPTVAPAPEPAPQPVAQPVAPQPTMVNPAMSAAPIEPVNNVAPEPVLNTNATILPPPPAPNVGMGMMPPVASTPAPAPTANMAQIPAPTTPPMPGAFQIPGM